MQKIGKIIEDEVVYDIKRVKKDPNKGFTEDNITEYNINPNISIIANNFEKYMSFRIGNPLQFIDSLQFMSSGLDRLSSNLPKDRFIYTDSES